MTTLRVAVTTFVSALGIGLSAAGAAVAQGPEPYGLSGVAAFDDGEVAVFWREKVGTPSPAASLSLRAAIGTPGGSFGAAATIIAADTHSTAVRGDAAGNVVVAWEESVRGYCNKGDCDYSSLGVFVSLRPAGGSFRAPERLSAPQGFLAAPRFAMNRNGDWVVVMREGADIVVTGAKGATVPLGRQVPRASGLASVSAFALDAAGNATLAGLDADRRPATIVRRADGSIGELTVLDSVQTYDGPTLAVGPQGDAVALWEVGAILRHAARPSGGSFGAAVSSAAPAGSRPTAMAVDGHGRTVTVFSGAPFASEPSRLQVARGTVQAPFGEAVTVSDPARYASPPSLGMSSDGNAVLLWPDIVLPGPFVPGRDPAWQMALAIDGGPFSAPRRLASAANERIEAAASIDGTGRVVVAWTSLLDLGTPNNYEGDVQRILVSSLSPQGVVAGPTVVAQRMLGDPRARARAARRQVLTIRRDATIRPLLTCASFTTPSCRATVRLDARAPGGRGRIHVGAARFVHRSGRPRRVTVRVSRAARRAARDGSLKCRIVVRTQKPDGWLTATTSLTIRRSGW